MFLFGYGNFGRQLYKNLSLLGYEIIIASANEEHIENAKADNVAIVKINIKRNDDIFALNIDQERYALLRYE